MKLNVCMKQDIKIDHAFFFYIIVYTVYVVIIKPFSKQ
jgi:hypothetical protein